VLEGGAGSGVEATLVAECSTVGGFSCGGGVMVVGWGASEAGCGGGEEG
jgi:hypothetical protein